MKSLPIRKPIVVVHWGRSTLDYVVADRKSGRVRIMAAGSVAWHADEEDDRSPGEVLHGELQQLGVRRAELVVALGRASVDVVPLQLPPASDAELPELVLNQVMRDAGDIAESGAVDYVILPAGSDEPRAGFAFAVDAMTLQQVTDEAAKASLKPAAIVYRPLASVTLLQRVVGHSRRTMILTTLHEREADISVVRGGGLVYTRTARLNETRNIGDIAAQLAVEVRRSLAAASLAPDPEEQHLYVFGALQEAEQLVQDLAEELALPASLLDPLRSEQVEGPLPDSVAPLSPLVGMVYDHYGKSHATDFLHPKKPPAPPSYVRRFGFYAAAALVLIAIGGYYWWDTRQKTATDMAELRDKLDRTTSQLDKIQQKQAVVDAVWQWQAENVNWLDELYDLTRSFPAGSDAMIRRLSASPGRDGSSVIDLSVFVRAPDVITKMDDQLRDEYHDVRSKGVSEQGAGDYPWQFETRITLQPRNTEEYREELPEEQQPKEEPSGDIAADDVVVSPQTVDVAAAATTDTK